MQTNIQRQHKEAIILTPEDLKAISALITNNYAAPYIEAGCSEGSKLTTEDLQEILDYENPNFRRIESLNLRTFQGKGSSISITFNAGAESTCVISIRDTEDKRALAVADELGKRLTLCRPPYSPLTKLTFAMLGAIALILAAAVFVGLSVWPQLTSKQLELSVGPLFKIVLPLVLVAMALISYIERGWNWMFPRLWFSIGRQNGELKKRENVRNLIFVVIGLAFVINIIANMVTR